MDENTELDDIDDLDFIITDIEGICPDLGNDGLIPYLLVKDRDCKAYERSE